MTEGIGHGGAVGRDPEPGSSPTLESDVCLRRRKVALIFPESSRRRAAGDRCGSARRIGLRGVPDRTVTVLNNLSEGRLGLTHGLHGAAGPFDRG